MPKSRYVSMKPSYQTTYNSSQPPKNSKAVFEWETFKPLKDYSDKSLAAVFKRISNDIIERPYHYDPHKVFDSKGNRVNYKFTRANNSVPPQKHPGIAVYKQNHGTGHAIRQMFYTDTLIDKIALNGNKRGREIAQKINSNPEIKSILKLAAYCKRIGRTFDHEHDNPGHITIYSKRSSDMFAQMARELGYNEDLIQTISESMLEVNPPKPPKMPTTLSGKTISGISGTDLRDFSESVLMAAHMADLSRLFSVRRGYIQTALENYFEPEHLPEISTELVEMACKANAMTGNPVVKQEYGVKHKTTSIDGKRLVEVVNNIDRTIGELSTLRLTTPSLSVGHASPPKLSIPQTDYPLDKQNRVTGIIPNTGLGGGFIVQAINNANQPRSIQVHADGSIHNFKGGTDIQGYVANKMKNEVDKIFEHFNVTLPKPLKPSIPAISTKNLKQKEMELNTILVQLNAKVTELEGKAKTNPEGYGQIATELRDVYKTLIVQKNAFFQNPTVDNLLKFKNKSIEAIDSVSDTAKEHRGWHKVHPILRAFVGILATITIIPALVVATKSKHGFYQTFFDKPETDTKQKISEFKKKFQEQIKAIEDDPDNQPKLDSPK